MIKTSKITLVLLSIIILFGLFIRIFQLGLNPPSLFSDEVDAAYQAFTFNNLKSDYFGNKFPTHFHSFSDWRTPLIIYSISLSQKIFGFNEFSTRFPSVFFGVLSILVFFILIKEIFDNEKIALIGAFLLSISPWHIHYSRTAFEVSGMLLVFILSLYFLVSFIKHKKFKNFILFSLFSYLSIYFYSTAKLFVFITFFIYFIFYFKDIIHLPFKKILIFILFSLLVLLPFIIDTVQKKSGFRFSYISIFSDPTVSQQIDIKRQVDAAKKYGLKVGLTTTPESILFHNKAFSWFISFSNHYLSSFSTNFLFINGDSNLRQGFGEFGNLYYLDFFLIILGFWYLTTCIKNKGQKKVILFLFVLFLSSPIPFALTNDSISPHATRLIIMLPFLLIFGSSGFYFLISKIKLTVLKISYISALIILYFFSFVHFYHFYFFHYPQKSAQDWHTGIKEAVLESYLQDYNKIYFVNSGESFLPFFLFWTKYLPDSNGNVVSQIKNADQVGFSGSTIQDKYYFGHIETNNFLSTLSAPVKFLFIVNSLNLEEISNQVQTYNTQKHTNFKINIIKEIKPNFELSQRYTIFSLTN